MTECRVPKDRAELAAEKDACSNSNLEVWNGFTSSFNRISVQREHIIFFALACLIMDMNGLYANTSC